MTPVFPPKLEPLNGPENGPASNEKLLSRLHFEALFHSRPLPESAYVADSLKSVTEILYFSERMRFRPNHDIVKETGQEKLDHVSRPMVV